MLDPAALRGFSSAMQGIADPAWHLWRNPPPKHHPTQTRHGEQVPIPRGLRGVGGQGAVRAVITDELLELGKQVHLRHSLPLRPARVHGVGLALKIGDVAAL